MQRVIEEKAAAQRRAHDEAVARSAAEQREQVKSLSCPFILPKASSLHRILAFQVKGSERHVIVAGAIGSLRCTEVCRGG